MKLNIGCGRDILNGWTNVDWKHAEGVDHVTNLEDPHFPIEWNGKVRKIYASHVFEHINNVFKLWEALYAVAAPKCELIVKVPHAGSDNAWGDPTHVRVFVEETFWSMGQPYYWRAEPYHAADWELKALKYFVCKHRFKDVVPWYVLERVGTHRNVVEELKALLVAHKPARTAGRVPFIASCKRDVEYV